MLRINKINQENKNNFITDPQLLNLRKEGIMESFDWIVNLTATILEAFEKLIGTEIKNDSSGRLEPVAIPVVLATRKNL
jgi:hypothetical protein